MKGTSTAKHAWEFKRRFRQRAFGCKGSRAAIQRIDEALKEIGAVTRMDRAVAAEGAIAFIERLSPALERVDSSSGALGAAVNNAIAAMVPIIVAAPVDEALRGRWLERLWNAHEADDMPYLDTLGDHWGELCASRETESQWADRLVGTTRMALGPDPNHRCDFPGAAACLSALFHAVRYEEIIDILAGDAIWPYKRWAVKALVALGRKGEAVRYAEACRGPWTPDESVDAACEEILILSGLADEAYERYVLTANRRGTYLAWFRAVARKYPQRAARQVLSDLVGTTPVTRESGLPRRSLPDCSTRRSSSRTEAPVIPER